MAGTVTSTILGGKDSTGSGATPPNPPTAVTAAVTFQAISKTNFGSQNVIISGAVTLPGTTTGITAVVIQGLLGGNIIDICQVPSASFSGGFANYSAFLETQPDVDQAAWVVRAYCVGSTGLVSTAALSSSFTVHAASLSSITFLEVGPRTTNLNSSVSSTFAVVPLVANSQYPIWSTHRIDYANGNGPQQLGQSWLTNVPQTSTTPVGVQLGAITFTVAASLPYVAGDHVIVISTSSSAYMFGTVTSYSGTTLVIQAVSVSGAGTYADWTVYGCVTFDTFIPTNASQTHWVAYSCTGAIAQNAGLPTTAVSAALTVSAVAAPLPSDVTNAQFVANAAGQTVIYGGGTTSTGPTWWHYCEIDWTQPTTAYDINYWFSSVTRQRGYAQSGSGTVSGLNTLTVGSAAFLQYAGPATIAAGGSGYAVGDTLVLASGTSTSAAAYLVTSLSGSAVTGVQLIYNGTYTAVPSNAVSTTGGSGSGCTLNVTSWYDQSNVLSVGNDVHINGILTTITGRTSSTVITFAAVAGVTNGACTFEIWNPTTDHDGQNTGLQFGYLGTQIDDSGSLSTTGNSIPGTTVALIPDASDHWMMPPLHNPDGTAYLYNAWRFRIYAGSRLMSDTSGGTLVLQTTCWPGGNDHQDVSPLNTTQPLDLMQPNPNTYNSLLGKDASGKFNFMGIQVLGGLPTLPSIFYPNGSVIQLSTDHAFYQNVSGSWSSVQDPAKLLVGAITPGTTITANYVQTGTMLIGGGVGSVGLLEVLDVSLGVVAMIGNIAGLGYGCFAKNFWAGGTTGAPLITLSGTSGSITGTSLTLNSGGVTTTINNVAANGLKVLNNSTSGFTAVSGNTFACWDGSSNLIAELLDILGSGSMQVVCPGAGGFGAQAQVNASGNGGAGGALFLVGPSHVFAIDMSLTFTATSATAGANTLPANPVGFLIFYLDGSPVKVPYYN